MKKIMIFALALALISSAAFASVDLSGMTFAELQELQKQVQLAMMETDEWQEVTVPAGTYEIGVEIPAGHWTISAAQNSMVNVEYGSSLSAGESGIDWMSTYDSAMLISETNIMGNSGFPSSISWKLKEGNYINIDSGSVVFTPYTGASFTFK